MLPRLIVGAREPVYSRSVRASVRRIADRRDPVIAGARPHVGSIESGLRDDVIPRLSMRSAQSGHWIEFSIIMRRFHSFPRRRRSDLCALSDALGVAQLRLIIGQASVSRSASTNSSTVSVVTVRPPVFSARQSALWTSLFGRNSGWPL